MKPRGSTGYVWNHFKPEMDNGVEKGRCNYCANKKYSIIDGSTSSMLKHLKTAHPEVWKDEEKSKLTSKQTAVDSLDELERIYQDDEQLQSRIGSREYEVLGHKIVQPKRVRRRSAQENIR